MLVRGRGPSSPSGRVVARSDQRLLRGGATAMPVAEPNRKSNPSSAPRLSRSGKPIFFPMDDSLMLTLMNAGLTGAERQVFDVIQYHLTTYGLPLADPQRISIR